MNNHNPPLEHKDSMEQDKGSDNSDDLVLLRPLDLPTKDTPKDQTLTEDEDDDGEYVAGKAIHKRRRTMEETIIHSATHPITSHNIIYSSSTPPPSDIPDEEEEDNGTPRLSLVEKLIKEEEEYQRAASFESNESCDLDIQFPSKLELDDDDVQEEQVEKEEPVVFPSITSTAQKIPLRIDTNTYSTTRKLTLKIYLMHLFNDVISPSPTTVSHEKSSRESAGGSMENFLQESKKNEKITNFIRVPVEIEKMIFFGWFICADSFLYNFTVLPCRIVWSLFVLIASFFSRRAKFRFSHQVDLMKGLIFIGALYFIRSVDASKVYHTIRGQSIIKLYMIFNLLEICDKLCSAFGHDILESLFTPPTSINTSVRGFNQFTHFIIALFYVYLHTVGLFYQVMTLNVAVNSYSNSLLTLLLSNQFVEIKGSVFKKFEKENLFQLGCSDIVERFQLMIFIFLTTLRNYIELTGNDITLSQIFTFISTNLISFFSTQTPTSVINHIIHFTTTFDSLWMQFFSNKHVQSLLVPAFAVLGTEMLVDWLKHAFITKFNLIHPGVYGKFKDSLCRALKGGEGNEEVYDHSPKVARKIGFVSLPLTCLVVRILGQVFDYREWMGVLFGVFVIAFLVKGYIGIKLQIYSQNRLTIIEKLHKRSSSSTNTQFTKPDASPNNTLFIKVPDDRFNLKFGQERSLDEGKLDQIDRFTMLKRII